MLAPILAGFTSRVTTASSACSSSAPLRPAASNISLADYLALLWTKLNAAITTSNKLLTTAALETLIRLSSSCAWRYYYTHWRAGLPRQHFNAHFPLCNTLSIQEFSFCAKYTSVNVTTLFFVLGVGDISVVIRRHYFSLSHPKNRICRAGRADRKQLHLLSDFPSDSVPNDRYILPPMQCVSNSRMPRPTNNYTAAAAGTASI
jgi:hypothetical protein